MKLKQLPDFPLVSIVTPSLNQARTIETTIRSVLDQDYSNIEYIVMDGGSTDGTLEILQKFNGRLYWESSPDAGQSDAINKGFRKAKGDIVAWLNSDDYYLPGAVTSIVDALKADPDAGFIYGGGYDTDEKGVEKLNSRVESFFDLWKLIHLYDFILQPSAFFRRELLGIAGYLDISLHYIMDWELWIRLAAETKVIYIDRMLSCNLVYGENKTMSGGIDRWKEIWACSRMYGHLRFPPAVITQSPVPLKHTKGTGPMPYLLSILKRVLVFFGLKVSSGIYSDGFVSAEGFLSIPSYREQSLLSLTVEPVKRSGKNTITVKVYINNREVDQFNLADKADTWKISLPTWEKERRIMHVRMLSAHAYTVPGSDTFPEPRRVSFRILKKELT